MRLAFVRFKVYRPSPLVACRYDLVRHGRMTTSFQRWAFLLILLCCFHPEPAGAADATPRRPFPQHVAYASGATKPNHVSQAVLDQKVARFYQAWKHAFVRSGCGPGRSYIYLGPQPSGRDGVSISVSEGQGYGMIITAFMAGHDVGARQIFDGLYDFYRDHPSQNHPDLMAWRQLSSCQSSSDRNSAVDGDLSIAYGLLLADKQWTSAGRINYRAQALAVLAAIREQEIHPATSLPQMGDWVDPAYPREYNALRSSDLKPGYFRAFAQATGHPAWRATLNAGYGMLDRMQGLHAPATGLLPDFVLDTTTRPRPADPGFVNEPRAGTYAFNACRLPWLVALDYLHSGDKRARTVVSRIEDWALNATGGDIYKFYAGYTLSGKPTVSYNYVCFTGALGVGAMVDRKYQAWLNRLWDDIAVETVADPADYYGATLRLLYLLVMSGNWWSPATR